MSYVNGKPPIADEEILRLLNESAPLSLRHVAIISLGNGQEFSGVFAKSVGYEGILTAGHSAEQFLANENLTLVLSEVPPQA